MNKDDLTREIQAIARQVFQKPDLVITDSLSKVDVDTWTSLSFMHFLTAIEMKYGFRFRMIELLQLQNMGAIINVTLAHLE